MHIAHALGHSISGGRRFAVATIIVAFCITLALAVGGSATANAAGPDILHPGQSVTYPTWLIGSTQVCATDHTGFANMVEVRPQGSNMTDKIYVPPYTRECIDRWWFGTNIDVTNISHTALGHYTLSVVETR
jgi:hypothetical protein